MVAVEAGLLMFGGVAGGDVPFAPECWLLQLGPSPLLGLKENEVTVNLTFITSAMSDCRRGVGCLPLLLCPVQCAVKACSRLAAEKKLARCKVYSYCHVYKCST